MLTYFSDRLLVDALAATLDATYEAESVPDQRAA